MSHDAADRGEPDMERVEETLRQRLRRWLTQGERDFEELCETLQLTPRDLESALRHIERTVRRSGERLVIAGPRCHECDFDFPGRESRHLHPPSRCPRCRSERIEPPRFRVEP